MSLSKIARFGDKRANHSHTIVMLPELWKWFPSSAPAIAWNSIKLEKANQSKIPKSNGVYTLDICPHVAKHENHSYVMYVGSGNLNERFSKYVKKKPSNDDLKRMLEKYEGYVYFSYFTVADGTYKTKEEILYKSIHPPYNRIGLTISAVLGRDIRPAF